MKAGSFATDDKPPFILAKSMDDTTPTQRLLDTLLETEKGGAPKPPVALSEADMTCTGCRQHMVHPSWILGKRSEGGKGSDSAI